MIIAGEASGDRHAAGLVREARAREAGLVFFGIGGRHLREQGMEILFEADELSVVGITEVLERLPSIRRALATVKARLREAPPDVLLLVDFPDFNLHVARVAAELGVPVVYFISPQIWAWRPRRVNQIKERVRRMLVLFPFEASFYRDNDVPVTFVGHPIADYVGRGRTPEEARRRLGLPRRGPVYGLLPGSRRGELRHHLAPMLEAAHLALQARPEAVFLVPVAESLDPTAIFDATSRSGLPIVALQGAFDPIAEACDAALAASGTVTLELAVRGVPPVVVYRTSKGTYLLGRMAVRVPHISLVNLVAERALVPELVQERFTPAEAARQLVRLGDPGPEREQVLAGLEEVRRRLGEPGAYARAAEALLEVLDEVAHEKETS
jgi:lipid-A-disaccharide synthase